MPINSNLQLFLILVATSLLTSGIWILSKYYYLIKNGELTTGTIVSWKRLYSRRGNPNYIPIIEFSTAKGKRVQLRPVYIQFWLHPYLREGQPVGLIYDKKNPSNALVISVLKIEIYGWMLTGGAVVIFAFIIWSKF